MMHNVTQILNRSIRET
jgi:ankyrin repeat protein